MCLEPYEAFDSYITIREELKKYSDGLYSKREVICLTKIDAMSEEEIEKFQKFFEEQLDKNVLPISSVSGKNIDELKFIMLQTTKAEEVQ